MRLKSSQCCLLLYIVLAINAVLAGSSNATEGCYIARNDNIWKLVYHDEFTEAKLNENWLVEHETRTCHGNYLRQVSCNIRQNVYQMEGFLALIAQYEPYLENNYTGASATTRAFFGVGRIEVRASLPVALHTRTVMHTISPNDTYWHENGQVDVSNLQESIVYRGVHLSNSRDKVIFEDLNTPENLHDFHIYGFEWNETMLQFFFNDLYSKPIVLTSESGLRAPFQIIFRIGVGLEFFNQKLPEDFQRLRWQCPAFVIDYIRVYKKVSSVKSLRDCSVILHNSDSGALERICAKAMKTVLGVENSKGNLSQTTAKDNNPVGNSKINLTVVLLLVFIVLVVYLLIQINKVQKKVDGELPASTDTLSTAQLPDQAEDYYEIPEYIDLTEQNQISIPVPTDWLQRVEEADLKKQHQPVEPKTSNEQH